MVAKPGSICNTFKAKRNRKKNTDSIDLLKFE